MSFDAFLYSESHGKKIKGESQDAYYLKGKKNAIELLSFELGAENNINIGSISAGGGAGKATFKEFTITKKTDTSSAHWFHHCVTGEHFTDMVVELRRSAGGHNANNSSGATFMRFDFRMVMVQDISWSGSDGDDICEETLILQYGAIQVRYYKQDEEGKHVGNAEEAVWSRVLNSNVLAVKQ